MKLVLATIFAAAMVGIASRVGDPALDAYTAKLHAAKSLTVSFKLAANGPPEECSLSYSSPNKLRIETPEKLTVSDGVNTWMLDKANNTYTESAGSTAAAMDYAVYAWRGFFSTTPFADATAVSDGGKRTIGGVDVQGYKLALPKDGTATIYLATTSGLAQVGIVNAGGKSWTAIGSKVQLGDATLPDSTFAFTAPDGAKKVEPPAIASASFDAAEAVMKQYCTGCHGADSRKAGLDLSTYDAVMAGRNGRKIVVAGDPSGSRLIQVIAGSTKKMPPGDADPVPADGVKTISDWIAGGAKNP